MLSRHERLAATVIVGAIEGPSLTGEERTFMSRFPIGGITLFRRNTSQDWAQVRNLVADVRGLIPGGDPAPVIAIDQEGGRVTRLNLLKPSFPDEGPAQMLAGGRSDPASLEVVKKYGGDVAAALKKLGVNVNFAPVCDVLTNLKNDAIGDRVFSTNPQAAADRAAAFLQGMQSQGVKGCLKHFPGQGDAAIDTHQATAKIDTPFEILDSRELIPFKALMPKSSMIMISHVIYSAIDSKPASLSSKIIGDLLRGQLGFTGVVVSDDMNMGAVASDESAFRDSMLGAVVAGGEMLLVCRHLHRWESSIEAIAREASSSPAFTARLEQAAERLAKLRRKLY